MVGVPVPAAREAAIVESAQIAAPSPQRMRVFDPEFSSAVIRNDPILANIYGKWRDRQQHGRLAYEEMMKHPAVEGPFNLLLSFLKATDFEFAPPARDPTPDQIKYAKFLNAQLKRLTAASPHSTVPSIIEGLLGQALEFGFSLAEFSTVLAPFKDSQSAKAESLVQVAQFRVFPQASLDSGWMPREERNLVVSIQDPRYRCFDMDDFGNITAYYQYRTVAHANDPYTVKWSSPRERNRIIHVIHGGGDGNPFGRSLLYSAFYAWSDLYLLERIEQVFIEGSSTPWITASYKGDAPSPAVHQEIKDSIEESDPVRRVLIGLNTTFGTVSATNPDFVKHIGERKRELRAYIAQALLSPQGLSGTSFSQSDDLDTRNMLQIMLKVTVPSLLRLFADAMTWQFGRRLLDANWPDLEPDDYPVLKFHVQSSNDLRSVAPVITTVLPHIDSDRLGESLETLVPGFRKEWIGDPGNSVAEQRQNPADALASGGSAPPTTPPPKQPGSSRERIDGETANAGGE